MSWRLRAAVAASVVAALAGCGEAPSAVPLPSRILPAAINGLAIVEDTAARGDFNVSNSLMSAGAFYVMRYSGYVYGSLEVVTLKRNVDATDIDQQQRIRSQIGTGTFHFYTVSNQWFGEQDSTDDRIYVWFPDFGADHVVEVLTLTNDFPQPRQFLAATVKFQETGS